MYVHRQQRQRSHRSMQRYQRYRNIAPKNANNVACFTHRLLAEKGPATHPPPRHPREFCRHSLS